MRRKWIAFWAAMLIAACFSVPAYAAGEISDKPPDDGDEVIVVYDWETGQQVGGNGTGDPAPIDTTMETVGDVPYITRFYELEDKSALADLPQDFEQDGYRFTRHEVYEQAGPATVDTKEASKEKSVSCETDDVAALLVVTDREFSYDEGGYSGTLSLDEGSIRFEEGERTSYSYTLAETREYPGLPYNDMALIEKTIVKNGATLRLDGIEWEVTATSQTDGGLVPTTYKGVATYSGRATGTKVSGYTAHLTYKGEVSREVPGPTIHAVVYRGEPVMAQAEEPVVEPVEKKKSISPWLYILPVLLGLGVITAAFFARRRKTTRYCTDGRFGDIWEGRDDDDYEPEPYIPDLPDLPAIVATPEEAAMEPKPEEEPAPAKVDTAASILSAIEGIDTASAPKARKKTPARKETIPLVEKLED